MAAGPYAGALRATGTPRSTTKVAAVGMRVRKYGRTTGQTNGRIDAINGIVNVNYGATNGVARFVNQIIIKPGNFSAGGDSGSLIVVQKGGDARKPVGLLFAGGFGITVANPIDVRFSEYFDEFDGPSIGGAANAAGIPAITVPNGFGERGLPTGLQFTGRAWDEAAVLGLAMEFQRRTDWHRRHPEL